MIMNDLVQSTRPRPRTEKRSIILAGRSLRGSADACQILSPDLIKNDRKDHGSPEESNERD